MGWNGSGSFIRARNWVADKAAGPPTNVVTASLMDEEDDNFAAGLENCLTVTGETTPTANQPMGGYRHTGAGSAQARTDYAVAGQVQDGGLTYAVSSGTDTVTMSLTPAITAYAAGQQFSFKAGGTNTTAVTLNVNSVGAKAVQKNGAALVAGDITANDIVLVEYDGTQFQMLSPARTPVITAGGLPAATDAARGAVELATSAEVATGSDTDRAVTPATAAANYIAQGKHSIYIPASAMLPTVSNGCAQLAQRETTAGRPDLNWLLFDASADEHAQFQIAFPKSWNLGTLTFQVEWSTLATDTDGVAWGLQAVAVGDADTADVAYGTPVVVTDDAQTAAEDVLVTAESSALTVDGTPAAGKATLFRIFRDVSDANDDMTEDAGLLGVRVFFTVNARTDA